MQEVIMIEDNDMGAKFWNHQWCVMDVEFITHAPCWNHKKQKVSSGWKIVGHESADTKERAIANWKLWDKHSGTPILVKGADLFRRWLENNPSEFKLND